MILKVFFLIIINIFSVLICVIANKNVLNNSNKTAAISLSAIHMIITCITFKIKQKTLFGEKNNITKLNVLDLSIITFFSVGSIVFPNIALGLSSITFYQISKFYNVLITVLYKYFVENEKTSLFNTILIISMSIGATITSKREIYVSVWGVFFSLCGILSTVLSSVFTDFYMKKYNLTSSDFIEQKELWSAVSCTILSICLDIFFQQTTLIIFLYYHENTKLLIMLLLSITAAVLVNWSSVSIIESFGALTYQVVGIIKHLAILAYGIKVLHEGKDRLKLFGIALALISTILYVNEKNLKKDFFLCANLFFTLLLLCYSFLYIFF